MKTNTNIAEFNNSDGLTPQQVLKLNYNFKVLQANYDAATSQDAIYIQENTDGIDAIKAQIADADADIEDLQDSVDILFDQTSDIYDDLANSMNYMGQKQTAAQLPSAPKLGDVWTIVQASTYGAAGTNVVWDGIQWLALGVGGGGGGGTSNYNDLTNKPSIEMVALQGNKTFPDLGIFIDPNEPYPQSDNYALTNIEITNLWNAS